MPIKVWDEITYPFLNFNGCTVEVYEWISNFIPYFIMDVITYMLVKGATGSVRYVYIIRHCVRSTIYSKTFSF